MCDVPVFYATTDGQTRRIAERFATYLGEAGLAAEAIEVTSAKVRDVRWDRAQAVVVAASVHAGHHQPEAAAFVRAHLSELDSRPSVFLSVSLAICSIVPGEVEAARATAERFATETGWRAGRVVCVAGRLAYTQYGLLKRFLMRRIARRAGGSTDTSRDHEMTDWAQVRAVAQELAASLARPAVAVSARSVRQAS